MRSFLGKNTTATPGFSTVELVGAVMLFTAATAGVLVMGKAVRDHRTAAMSTNGQNAYATFQSQVALQGINPSLVANPLAAAVNSGGLVTASATAAAAKVTAAFETGAVSQPLHNIAGSVYVDALAYTVAAAGNQGTRGAGVGFSIETAGAAPPPAPNAIPLAPPVFNITGDLTNAAFPLNAIATLPSGNPPGTVYRYTTDGSAPTGASMEWNNNPGWTPATFPAQVTLQAFNPDPQYLPSPTVAASYSMQLSVTYGRADGRTANLYDFTIADLAAPDAVGIVLSDNIDGYPLLYTLDGSDPSVSSIASEYNGAFAPQQSAFGPSATLKVVAQSNDARILASPVMTYVLEPAQIALSSPTFVTPNDQPLAPGTPVVISTGGGGSPRTEVNNGSPTQSSSPATSFPLN